MLRLFITIMLFCFSVIFTQPKRLYFDTPPSLSQSKEYNPVISRYPGSEENYFALGWYAGFPFQAPQAVLKIRSQQTIQKNYYNLLSNSPSNTILFYNGGNYFVGSSYSKPKDIRKVCEYVSLSASEKKQFPKQNIIRLDIRSYKENPEVFIQRLSNLQKQCNENILGFGIGDDLFLEVTSERFSWEDVYEVNNMIDDRWTLVSDSYEFMERYYDKFKKMNLFDIPMIGEYIYQVYDTSYYKTFPSRYKMVEMVNRFAKVKSQVIKYDQPGFIYISQAHGKNNQYGIRRATYEETVYDVFNSIVHGAGGVLFWAYYVADEVTKENVNRILRALTSGEIPSPRGSLHKALENGILKGRIISSNKDNYDADAEILYEGDDYASGKKPVKEYIGKGINDINYILREDDGIFYLVAINNSVLSVNNVTWFLPVNFPDKITQVELGKKLSPDFSSQQTSGPGSANLTLTTDFKPFEVKVFRFSKE